MEYFSRSRNPFWSFIHSYRFTICTYLHIAYETNKVERHSLGYSQNPLNTPHKGYRMVFASMRAVCLFLRARAVDKFFLQAARTLQNYRWRAASTLEKYRWRAASTSSTSSYFVNFPLAGISLLF